MKYLLKRKQYQVDLKCYNVQIPDLRETCHIYVNIFMHFEVSEVINL